MRKYEVLGMLNHGKSSILLRNYNVGAFFIIFGKVMKNIRKCMPKLFSNWSKIELGGAWSSTFEVLGNFWSVLNFDELCSD